MGPDSSVIVPLISGGIAGIFCILFVLGWVVPKWVVTDLKERLKLTEAQLEAANERANTASQSQVTMRDILAALTFGQAQGQQMHPGQLSQSGSPVPPVVPPAGASSLGAGGP